MLFHFDPTTTVMAYPAYEHRQGETLWSIELSISRDDLNYPKIDEVWSYGRKLTYRKIDRRRRFCEPVCRREERGQIILSQTGFAQAAETGLAFEIQGRRGTYDGSIQAFHFQRVLAQLRQN